MSQGFKPRFRRFVSYVGLIDMLLPTQLSKSNPYANIVRVLDSVYLWNSKGTACSVQPRARELAVVYRLGGVNSGSVPSR